MQLNISFDSTKTEDADIILIRVCVRVGGGTFNLKSISLVSLQLNFLHVP